MFIILHKNTHQNESNEKKEENEYMEEPEHGKHKHEHGKHKHKVKFTKLYIIEAVKLKLKEIDTIMGSEEMRDTLLGKKSKKFNEDLTRKQLEANNESIEYCRLITPISSSKKSSSNTFTTDSLQMTDRKSVV